MREQSIIIIAAKQMDIDECSALIRDDFAAIYSCTSIPALRELLEEHKSSILIICDYYYIPIDYHSLHE